MVAGAKAVFPSILPGGRYCIFLYISIFTVPGTFPGFQPGICLYFIFFPIMDFRFYLQQDGTSASCCQAVFNYNPGVRDKHGYFSGGCRIYIS